MARKKELIPASTLKRLEEDIEELEDQTVILKNIEKELKDLSKKVEESIKTSLDLQEKVSELMVRFIELVENIQKIVKVEKPKMEKSEIKELVRSLRSLETQLRRSEIKEAIRRALKEAIK